MFLQMLVNGEIPEAGVQVMTGLLVLAGIGLLVIGFVAALKGMRKSSDREYEQRLLKAVGEREKQIEIDTTLKGMKDSIDKLNDSVTRMRGEIGERVDRLESKVEWQSKQVVKIDASTRAAHKRMNEHRQVEHKLPSNGRNDPEEMGAYEDDEEDKNR